MSAPQDHDLNGERFQVDLRGVIDLLSRHLYSGPSVFVREMLQNAVDAIRARNRIEPGLSGKIQIELMRAADGPATLLFQDNGIGLTESEIHQFLATIGQSSKRGQMTDRPDDFIGQFGIGLLSCFMITEEIVVITRSATADDAPTVEWRGSSNGTYSVRVLDHAAEPGTQVYLRCKPGTDEFFQADRLRQLTRDYGSCLLPDIEFTYDGVTERVNTTPPWEEDLADNVAHERLLEFGQSLFDREFLDIIPLQSSAGNVQGIAYVLAQPVHAGVTQRHRVYLKNMLLSTNNHEILPEWAFFVQCVVNAQALRPTASRESFYEDDQLEQTRFELGTCLRRYLVDMARHDPRRFQYFLSVHQLAAKAIAIEDDECLQLFADWLPFETTLGTMTLGEFRREHPVIRYVPSRDQFRQLSQVAASESVAIINAGYVYDVDILKRVGEIRPDVDVEVFEVEQLSERFEPLDQSEREETITFEQVADTALQRYKCAVEIAKFKPRELPALYVTNENADFLRSVEQSKEVTNDVWSGVLDSIEDGIGSTYATLHLNYQNPVVRRICSLQDSVAQRRCVEMLYVQSLLLGHFPLKRDEVKLLNEGLIGLIDWAIDTRNREDG